MRNHIISIYQPSHLASLIPTIQPYIERSGRLLRHGEEITFSDLSLKLFSNTMGQVAFGVDFSLTKDATSLPPNHQIDGVDSATDFIQKHFYASTSLKMDLSGSLSVLIGMLQEPVRQLLLRVPGSADRRMEETNNAMSGLLDKIVAERAAQVDRGQRPPVRPTEWSVTMSFTLSSLVYLVAMHQEVEEKLLWEIDAFGPKDVVPNAEELEMKFPYLEQVLKEAMRFYTVVPLVAREASEDVEVGGHVLHKGAWVWLAPGALAKDPKEFPDPDVFRPERFDPENEECKRRHPYAFIPFGIGPRACIGQKFAIQQLKLVIIHLYRHYVFRHSPSMEFPLQLQYSITVNFKHGLKLQVIERKT